MWSPRSVTSYNRVAGGPCRLNVGAAVVERDAVVVPTGTRSQLTKLRGHGLQQTPACEPGSQGPLRSLARRTASGNGESAAVVARSPDPSLGTLRTARRSRTGCELPPRPAWGLGGAAGPTLSGSARCGSLAALAVVALSGATAVPGRGLRRRSSQMSSAPPVESGVVSYCWRVEHLPFWPPFPPCGGQFMSPARAGVRRSGRRAARRWSPVPGRPSSPKGFARRRRPARGVAARQPCRINPAHSA